jgi:serine/threonine-protein kinase
MDQQLGRYRIEAEIGRGAMGVVYRASDPLLERVLAVKAIHIGLKGEDAERYEARFYQEARAAAKLNHPNIVTVYDAGKSGAVAYIAMEFIEGVELRDLLAAGHALGVRQALSIAAQLAEALAYAHKHGIVHRDIKPANVMVVPNAPLKITDFGIARMRAAPEAAQAGNHAGSPRYMSPEQVLGQRADHRTDLFSLGVILYEMLTGVAPFGGENVTALMYQIVNVAPPAPGTLRAGVPPEIDAIVARLLAKPLEARYQSAADAARDLRDCEQGALRPGAVARAAEPGAAALAPGAEPAVLDERAKSVILAQSAARTRGSDTSG